MKYLADSNVQTVVIYLVILLLGFLSSVLPKIQESKKIPKSWQTWIDRISEAQIQEWINDAEKMLTLTPTAKRDYVVKCLENHAADYLGEFIPHGVATMVVEYMYQKMKGRLAA